MRAATHIIGALLMALVVYQGGSSIDPIDALTYTTGYAGVGFALYSLAARHLKQVRSRRPAGLWAAFFGGLHLAVFILNNQFDLLANLLKFSNIIGLLVLIFWLPLVLTSTRKMMRRLKILWAKLHRLAYPAAVLAITHWMLSVKEVPYEAYAAAIILFVLLWKKS